MKQSTEHKEVIRLARPFILLIGLVAVGFFVLMSQIGPVPIPSAGPSTRMIWLAAIFPVVFGVLEVLFVMPSHIAAWGIGAEGEERTGRILAELEAEGYRAIDDRKIPGSRANIDHIVVGPTGIFVVETKSYEGRVRVTLFGELKVGGLRKNEFVDQAKREAAAVAAVVAPHKAMPIICFHRADMGWEIFPAWISGVRIVSAARLCKAIRKGPDDLTTIEVADLADRLERALRPA